MIKNAIIYRYAGLPEFIEHEVLEKYQFAECGATQQKSLGWIPPRGHEHGALVELVGRTFALKLRTETKAVPASVLDKRVNEKAAAIEDATGRKPGRHERKDLKEEVLLELLPAAFPKQQDTLALVLLDLGILVIDAASASRAEDVVTLLIKCFEGLTISPIQTNLSPAVAMASWLTDGMAPGLFGIGRESVLKAPDEMKSTVRYGNHTLDIDEVKDHIKQGKVPQSLRLNWNDRVDLTLADIMQLKKVSFDDIVFEGPKGAVDEAFDADVAITTGELVKLLPDLIEALDGEMVPAVLP